MAEGFPYELCSVDEPLLPSQGPLIGRNWSFWLYSHPDRVFVRTLTLIIERGVRIGFQGPQTLFITSPPHPTASDAPDVLDKDLQKQLDNQRLSVVTLPLHPPSVVSLLGLVPKRDGGFRRIYNLLFPKQSSVNDYILDHFGALEYVSIDDAIELILQIGRGTVLVKKDFTDAFRYIPIAIADRWLLRFLWNEVIYKKCFLPFGLRTAPFIFDLFAKDFNWILIEISR